MANKVSSLQIISAELSLNAHHNYQDEDKRKRILVNGANKEKKDKRKTSQRMLFDDGRIKHKFKVNGNLSTVVDEQAATYL